MEKLFNLYFMRNGHNNGQSTLAVPPDGNYPPMVMHEGGIYRLWDADYQAAEAHYEYYGKPEEPPISEKGL